MGDGVRAGGVTYSARLSQALITASFAVFRRSFAVGMSYGMPSAIGSTGTSRTDLVFHYNRMHIQINDAKDLGGTPLQEIARGIDLCREHMRNTDTRNSEVLHTIHAFSISISSCLKVNSSVAMFPKSCTNITSVCCLLRFPLQSTNQIELD